MKKNTSNPGFLGSAALFLSRILLMYQTRNIYSFNSLWERILPLFTAGRRHKGMRIQRTCLQYSVGVLL